MKYFMLVPLFFISFLINSLSGQNVNSFDIEIQLINPDKLQEIYLADIDLQNFGTANDVFLLTIRNHNPSVRYSNCILEISFFHNEQLLISGQSDPFNIPAGFTEKTFTNKELSFSGFDFGEGNVAYFHQVHIAPEADKLKKQILASGKLPFGVYKVLIKLYQQTQAQMPLGQNEVVLFRASNPSYLQLISPGTPVGNGLATNIYSEFPVFQWTGNGSEYQVLVFEKKDMMQSMDDIINSQPNWKSERMNKLSVQYPQAGDAIPLEYGKTYYWMVRMFIQTSGGEKTLDSEVWAFTLMKPEQSDNFQNQMVREDILRFLGQILGPQIEDVRASLEGYRLKHIRYNGEEITLNQLYQILNSYRGKSFKIIDFIPPTPER